MVRIFHRFGWLVLAGLLVHSEVRAEALQVHPDRDATLFEDPTGRFANGAGQWLFVGRTWDQNGIEALLRRALIRFDLAAVPPGSQVLSAELHLLVDRVPPGAAGALLSVHRVTRDWGEGASNAPGPEGQGTLAQPGDATWLSAFHDSVAWTNPGGDFAANPVASAPLASSDGPVLVPSSPGLVALVQDWVDDPGGNHGVALLGDEQLARTARRLLSRENRNPGAPALVLEFVPPTEAVRPVPAGSTWGWAVLVLFLLAGARAGLRPVRTRA